MVAVLIGDIDDFQRLQEKIDDEKSPKKYHQFLDHWKIIRLFGAPADEGVHQHQHGDAADDGRHQEYDRLQWCCPPGIRLDRSENEAHITVEKTCPGYTQCGEKGREFVIDPGGFRRVFHYTQGQGFPYPTGRAFGFFRLLDEVLAIDQPEFDHQ